MASLEQIQEISNRGLQSSLSPEKRAKFDELVRRGLITSQDTVTPPTIPQDVPVAQEAVQAPQLSKVDLPIQELDRDGKIPENGLIPIEGPAGGAIGVGEALFALGSGAFASQASKTLGFMRDFFSIRPPGPKTPEQEQADVRFVEELEKDLTFVPRTEPGAEALNAVGTVLGPISSLFEKAEQGIGNFVLEKTGSPTAAGLAASFPTVATEVLGFKGSKALGKAGQAKTIAKAVDEAVPTTEQLKETARGVYKEIDKSGVTVNQKGVDSLLAKIADDVDDFGAVDPTLTPKSNAALNQIQEGIAKAEGPLRLSEVTRWRKIAQIAARSVDNTDAAFGNKLLDRLDDFVEQGDLVLDGPPGFDVNAIAGKKKLADNLWGRAKRADLMTDIMEKASLHGSGINVGLRNQLRTLINNPKRAKWFPKGELAEMKKIVKGKGAVNWFNFIGKFGFTMNQATQALGGLAGSGLGFAAGGGVGAVAVPMIGTVSRSVANGLMKKQGELFNKVIRAGKNGKEIAEAYLAATPKSLRTAQDLSQLLLKPGVDLSALPKGQLMLEAKKLVSLNRATATGAAAGISTGATENGNLPQ